MVRPQAGESVENGNNKREHRRFPRFIQNINKLGPASASYGRPEVPRLTYVTTHSKHVPYTIEPTAVPYFLVVPGACVRPLRLRVRHMI